MRFLENMVELGEKRGDDWGWNLFLGGDGLHECLVEFEI